jgi:MFS family permease
VVSSGGLHAAAWYGDVLLAASDRGDADDPPAAAPAAARWWTGSCSRRRVSAGAGSRSVSSTSTSARTACSVLAVGQVLLALAPGLPMAVLARVVVGAGDAVMFVAVLALVPRWFSTPRVPLVTQLTGILAQIGQILSAVLFVGLLHANGWTSAFGTAAAASALAAVLALALVRNAPVGGWTPAPRMSQGELGRQVRAVWRRPGTRLGFFGHMGTQLSMMVFSLLWGMPYLVTAQGRSAGAAGGLLSLFVVCTILIGPVVGMLTMRHPMRRS